MTRVAADALVVEANDLLRAEQYLLAAQKFERAAEIFPQHPLAWKGLGHALLCMGKAHEAAHAFDHAIGLAPTSATALWGGAVAHADIGNKVVAQNYLRRTLALQPTWLDMARGVPQLAPFLQVSTRGADALRRALGPFSTRTYRHANDDQRAIEIGRLVDIPKVGLWTFVTIGLSNREWPERGRPRCELVLATSIDTEVCGQILANLSFHLSETGYFPEPGMIVRDVVGALGAGDLSQRLPHVYITPPKLWRIELPIDPGPPAITLAQVVPVSEAEYGLWRSNVSGFERLLGQRGVDLTDLKRG